MFTSFFPDSRAGNNEKGSTVLPRGQPMRDNVMMSTRTIYRKENARFESSPGLARSDRWVLDEIEHDGVKLSRWSCWSARLLQQ
jgi:hypothetical protein